MAKAKPKSGKKTGPCFVTFFRHYRTGKILFAADYGYKAWPFGRSK